ncbi:undecaprenyl-phosphate glucose phosphotransferase [Ectothiorhodospiraceae bacterium 2226]|nr:undecaprenyl-phosphate glucose phosphotransferase [Ectothiorhodospiraceae bacterium 2226]
MRPYHSKFVGLSQAADALCIGLTLWVITSFYGLPWLDLYTLAVASGIGLFIFFAPFHDLYRSWRAAGARHDFSAVWLTWLSVVMALLFLAYATQTSEEFSRRAALTWFLVTPMVLLLWRSGGRMVLGHLRQRGFNSRRVAVVGAREVGAALVRNMLDAPWSGLRPVGFYDDRKPAGLRPLVTEPLKVVGDLDRLVKHAQEGRVDIIYIALPMRAEKRIQRLLAQLSDTTASVYVVPDFFMFNLLNSTWTQVGDLPVVSIFETPFYGVDGWIKRLEDIVLSSVILLIIAIPMLLIALGIKLSSPGPVLFKQDRYGLRGNRIEVWKFRTMHVCENGAEVRSATRDDPRVTRFGAFLRQTSLDELPQFINVLQGRMSIVGPRPHAVVHNEQYRKLINGYMLRHKVKPGITGLAQINGWRGEVNTLDKMQKRVEYDLAYIHNWSLFADIKIIFMTVFKGFVGKNAY